MPRTPPATPEALMRGIAEAFERSDLRPLLAAIDDNCVWRSAATVEGMFRFGGKYTGRAGVIEVTSQIASAYTFYRLKPKEIVSANDIIWGLFDVEGAFRERDTGPRGGKAVRFECAIRWRLREGKIIEHQCFFDTATLLVQQRGAARKTSDDFAD